MEVLSSFEEKINNLSKSKLEKLYTQLKQKYIVALYLYNDKKETFEVLSSKDEVRNSIEYREDSKKIKSMIDSLDSNLKIIEQKLCKHNYLYIYDEVCNIYGKNKLYCCKCLDCEKEMFLNDKEIKHINTAKSTIESPKSLDIYWNIKKQIDYSNYLPFKKKLKK